MKISCLVPTRGRVVGMTEFTNSIFTTANNPNEVEIIFYIDNDDLPSKECEDKLKEDYNIKYLFKNRVPLSKAINDCHTLSESDIFFCGSDDIVMLTKGWDDVIIHTFDKIEDKIALLYGLDKINRTALFGTHPIVHIRWLDVLGYITPQYFGTGDYGAFSTVTDKWVNSIARDINRQFFINIFNCHIHPRYNTLQKTPPGYTTRQGGHQTTRDLALLRRDKNNNPKQLYKSLEKERKIDRNKLKQAITDFQFSKINKFIEENNYYAD